jgi:hypothetical protein
MKKVYLAPTLEILEFEAENVMVSTSEPKPGIGSGGGEETNPLTNKRQPIGGTWNSDNWNQVEE